MKRPLFSGLLFMVCGLVCAFLVKSIGVIIIFISVAFLSTAFVKKYNNRGFYIFSVFFVMGFLIALSKISKTNEFWDLAIKEEAEITVFAKVIDMDKTASGNQRLTLNVQYADLDGDVSFDKSKIQAIIQNDISAKIGDEITLKGLAYHFDRKRNPGGYDEYLYMSARKFQYNFYGEIISVKGSFNSIYSLSNDLRNRIARVFYEILPEKEAAVINSMITGDNSSLDDFIVDLYKESGIFHLIVISGSHLSVLAFFMEKGLNNIFGRKFSAVVTISFLAFYCFFTGFGIATVRALIMFSTGAFAKYVYKENDIACSACVAAIILLLYEPLYLFDIGFQYSFSAVFGIGLVCAPFDKIFLNYCTKFRDSVGKYVFSTFVRAFIFSAGVFAATLPINIYHFNVVNINSIFMNMAAIPLSSVLIVAGFAAGLLGLIYMPLAHVLSGVLYFILNFYEKASQLSIRLPFNYLAATPPYLIAIVFFIPLFAVTGFFTQKKAGKSSFNIMYVSLAIYIFAYGLWAFYPRNLSLTMLDVGQGDAGVIEFKNKTYIIDGGGWANREGLKNTGQSVIIPYLHHKGIQKVDGVFISHLDLDHISGIIELIESGMVEKAYLPITADKENSMYLRLLDGAEIWKTEILFLEKGDIISDGNIDFKILAPAEDKYYPDENEGSMVLIMESDFTALFTGDIGFRGENMLIEDFAEISADVLKVSHHGSKYSTGEEFLQNVSPEIAILGAGKRNSYSHPSPEVVNLLEENGVKLYSTNKNGAITLIYSKQGFKINTMIKMGDSN